MGDSKGMEPSFDESFADDPEAVIDYIIKNLNDLCDNETVQKMIDGSNIQDLEEQTGTYIHILKRLKLKFKK